MVRHTIFHNFSRRQQDKVPSYSHEQLTYDVAVAGTRHSKRWNITMNVHDVTVRDLEDVPFHRAHDTIISILDHIRTTVLEPFRPTDRVRLSIESSSLKLGIPVWTPLTELSQLTTARWMMEVEKVLNSQESFVFDGSFKVRVDVASPPGGACRRDVPKQMEKFLAKMHCVISVNNEDEICMARALVIAKATVDCGSSTAKPVMKLRRGIKAQRKAAQVLVRQARLPFRRFTIDDLPAFERVLGDKYQVYVLSLDHASAIVYPKPASGQEKKTPLLLLLHNEHFDVCTSIAAFFERGYFCFKCRKGYNNKQDHRCDAMCVMCLRADCPKDEDHKITCDKCHREFLGDDCYQHHLHVPQVGAAKFRSSICSKLYRCQDCHCTVSEIRREASNPHKCGETFCKHCRLHVLPEQHRCFMKPITITPKHLQEYDTARFLYFDLETYVNDQKVLVANYAVRMIFLVTLFVSFT